MVEGDAHVAAGHKREAIDALARGERLERSGTRSAANPEGRERGESG
jgi:hypothetical protein